MNESNQTLVNVDSARSCNGTLKLDGPQRNWKPSVKRFSRRSFLGHTAIAALGFLRVSVVAAEADWIKKQLQYFHGQDVLSRISQKATKEKWKKLPIGEVVGKVAMELAGTPWLPFTWDVSPDQEFCVVNLTGVDCFTFIEYSLCIARAIKREKTSPEDLIQEVQLTLYRGGKMGDFSTRLHYTSDWMYDNSQKGVLEVLTPKLPGAQPFTKQVNFMSTRSAYYKQLKSHPELIEKIKVTEAQINARGMTYLPINKVKDAERLLKTGDIIGATELRPGIDIGHCGLVFRDENKGVHFVDASSIRKKMRVSYEPDLANSIKGLS